MNITLTHQKKTLFVAAIVSGVILSPPVAKALDFGALFSAGTSLFQSLSSGDFNLGSIFSIAGDVSTISGGLGGPSLGNLSSSLGSLSSSPDADYSLGSGNIFDENFESGSGLDGDYSTTPGIGGGLSGGGNSLGLNRDTFDKVARSSDYIRGLYGSIQSGSLGGSIENVLGIAGVFGLLDPNDISSQPGSGGQDLGNPSGREMPSLEDELKNAKYPIDVYYAGQKRQNIYKTSNHDLSQLVLGKPGQQLMANQAKEQSLAIAVGEQSTAKIGEYVGSAAKLNQSQEKAVQSAEKMVATGIKTKQSLDALHVLIGLGGVHSGQFALLSGGQTLNTAALAQMAKQQNAGNAINKINGDALRDIKIQTAATNNAVTLAAGDIDAMHRHQLDKEAAQMSHVTQSQGTFLFPGLFSLREQNGN